MSPRDNERLEYLGDAVLQLITAEYLFKLRPGAKEGEMTQIRSAMVNTNTLAALAEELDLGAYLYLGKGIARGGGRGLKSLLANAFEAVLGAVFLDAGYDAAYHYYLDRFRALPEPVQDENYKGRLQQVVQERFGHTPYYDSVSARGGRQREYTAVVYAGTEPLGTGHGATKQAAEQDAAHQALREVAIRDSSRRAAWTRPGEIATLPPPEAGVGPAGPDQGTSPEAATGVPFQADGALSGDPPAPAAEKPRRSRRRRPAVDAQTSPATAPAEPASQDPEQAAPSPPKRSSRRRRPASQAAPEQGPQIDAGAPTGSI